MSETLRYEIETNHEEIITGRIISSDLTFAVEVGNGKYGVTIRQDDRGEIHMHGGTLPTLIKALTEVHALYTAAVGRALRAVGSDTADPATPVVGSTPEGQKDA